MADMLPGESCKGASSWSYCSLYRSHAAGSRPNARQEAVLPESEVHHAWTSSLWTRSSRFLRLGTCAVLWVPARALRIGRASIACLDIVQVAQPPPAPQDGWLVRSGAR